MASLTHPKDYHTTLLAGQDVTTRVAVHNDYIVACRQLVTTADSKPREESTPIYVADVARVTAALQNLTPQHWYWEGYLLRYSRLMNNYQSMTKT